jgi:hypothetical protein
MTGFGVGFQHLAGDLSVARLVCSDETELIASEGGNETVKQKKAAGQDKNQQLARDHGLRPVPKPLQPAVR